MRWIALSAFGILLSASISTAPAAAASSCHAYHRYYRSVDGSMVHDPRCTNRHLKQEMAICRDGSRSVSHHHRGTCSHHGGVRSWG